MLQMVHNEVCLLFGYVSQTALKLCMVPQQINNQQVRLDPVFTSNTLTIYATLLVLGLLNPEPPIRV